MRFEIINKLEEELLTLDHELKVELPAEIKRAADHGDLSENAEYHAAKERKRMVEARISLLQKRVSDILNTNVKAIPKDRVGLKSKVKLEDLDSGKEVVYEFVFPEEVEPDEGKISLATPIGKSLVGKQEGDDVVIVTPKGSHEYEILELKTIHDRDDVK